MSAHVAVVDWRRNGAPFGIDYDRTHLWRFDGGVEVPASSAPELFGDPTRVDPEEAFVASISSCHMMWFLYLAAEAGLVVDGYRDEPVGTMTRRAAQELWISEVDLRPVIDWEGDPPSPGRVDALHAESHRRCFIANSVRTAITVHGSAH